MEPVVQTSRLRLAISSVQTLQDKDRLGERLLKAYLFTVNFARTQPEMAQKLLGSGGQPAEGVRRGNRAASVARMPMRPYPDNQADRKSVV